MCGRYSLYLSPRDLADFFALVREFSFEPRYNIAPSQEVPVIREREGERRLDLLRWGLVPFWADDVRIGTKLINARAETAASKPSFRAALRARRCIVPASGFYEWQPAGKGKRPFHVTRRDGRPLALAGLWERWQDPQKPGETLESCTLLTTEANEELARLHDRMPVLLEPPDFAAWLDPERQSPKEILPLLRPAPAGSLALAPVSDYVNKPGHEGRACLEPAEGSG